MQVEIIEKYKQILLAKKEQLLRELNEKGLIIEKGKDWAVKIENDDEEHADPVDEATLTETLEKDILELSVLENNYREVEEALHAIEKGRYGICKVCGKEIPEERLSVYPETLVCIDHADTQEIA